MTTEELVDRVLEIFEDGFQAKDIWEALPLTMTFVESLGDLSGTDKKEKVFDVMDTLLGKVNLPGWDWLTKKAILWAMDYVIEALIKTANGEYDF